MVYRVRFNSTENKIDTIECPGFSYVTPKKIYGSILNEVSIVWDTYCDGNEPTSVLLTGRAGAGKTLFANLLVNFGIRTKQDVYIFDAMKYTDEVINFLSDLKNCIVFIDEFEKVIDRDTQQKLLPLLTEDNHVLFIFAANYAYQIIPQILNRPQRLRYHYVFERMEDNIIEEYCKDYNAPINFQNQLLDINLNSELFSFNALETLVSESIKRGIWDVNEHFKRLNLQGLKRMKLFKVVSIVNIENNDMIIPIPSKCYTNIDKIIFDVPEGIIINKVIECINNNENKDNIISMLKEPQQQFLVTSFKRNYNIGDETNCEEYIINLAKCIKDTVDNQRPEDRIQNVFNDFAIPGLNNNGLNFSEKLNIILKGVDRFLVPDKSNESSIVYKDTTEKWYITVEKISSKY